MVMIDMIFCLFWPTNTRLLQSPIVVQSSRLNAANLTTTPNRCQRTPQALNPPKPLSLSKHMTKIMLA
jgi:hypothetical protein